MAHNFQVCHKSNILPSALVKCEDKIYRPSSSFHDLAPTWTATMTTLQEAATTRRRWERSINHGSSKKTGWPWKACTMGQERQESTELFCFSSPWPFRRCWGLSLERGKPLGRQQLPRASLSSTFPSWESVYFASSNSITIKQRAVMSDSLSGHIHSQNWERGFLWLWW